MCNSAISRSEEHGGGGLDYWFSVVKAEELPRSKSAGVGMGLLVQSDMATPVISDLGTPEQIDEFLKPALAGEKIACLGVSEPAAGSDVAGIKTVAKKDGSDYIISGQKTFITNGTRADFITLLVKTNPEAGAHGCSFFLVPTKTKGFQVAKALKKIGNRSSDTAELFFDDMRVPCSNLLGTEEGRGFVQLMEQLPKERLIIGVGGVATMQRAIDETLAYVQQRQIFGKPLMAMQNTRFKLAECQTKLTIARSFIDDCIARAMNDTLDVATASMSKWWVSEMVSQVVDECVQLHGGYGYMNYYPVARLYADTRVGRIYGGSNEVMKELIARAMDGGKRAG